MVTKAKFFQVVTDFASSWGLGGGGVLKSQKTVQFVTIREGKF